MSQDLPSTSLVIFGVSGDLSRRYLMPALSEICKSSEVYTKLNIVGLSRREIHSSEVLTDKTSSLSGQLSLLKMDYTQLNDYDILKNKLEQIGSEQVIFYFAVPPDAVLPIVQQLGSAGLNSPNYKLLMEKPFGTDLESASTLIKEISEHFKEEQVYRIDHYLAKGMAQNVSVFLGSNALFKGVWNNQFIERIEVVAEESVGVEGREHFYEQTGALRDFIQSHMLQLAALTMMAPPKDVFDFGQMPAARLEVLNKLSVDTGSVIKAQYKGYGGEVGNPVSNIETFVSVNLTSSDPKWQGVQLHLATGKKMSRKLTEVRVYFKKAEATQSNLLKIKLHPEEGIEFEVWIKKPGYDTDLQMLPMDFTYQKHFDNMPDAYEQVIVDAIRSRTNLFPSSAEVLASWTILQPLLDQWGNIGLKTYEPGSHIADVINNT